MPIIVIGVLILSGFGAVALNSDNEKLDFETIDFENTGGGNREEYEEVNQVLAKHTLYADDEDDGFVVKGDGNRLINNRAIGNAEDGFDVSGNRNTFKTNSSKDNLESGFTFDYNTTGNKIFRNEALENRKIDIEAENDADCENNLWKNNRFETSNPACIK